LQELTQPDPSNRASVGSSPADLQTLAHDVIQGDFGQVRRLATRQLVTSADAARRTVLMLVADAPETPVHTEKCILYLFELGANPKAADANGDTAAHLAARRDHLRLLTLLSFDAKWLRNDNGATPLMEAARTGSWRCAKHLLHLLRQRRFNECKEHENSKRSRLLRLKDREGRTASDLARLSGHSELASYIEREMRLVVSKGGRIFGLTAQEEADRQELQQLAEAGDSAGLRRAATRGSCDLPDRDGYTALMLAAHNSSCGDEALWEQLVQLGDPTCADTRAEICLHHAAGPGNSAAASALLAAGASANVREDLCDFTPLMAAAFAPPTTAAAFGRVLLDSGADWSLKDMPGRTALDLATQEGKSELAELLRGPPFLERWDKVRLIGRGGSGKVHEVRTDTGVTCAAKTLKLPVQLGDDQTPVSKEIHRAVESERNLCRLRHPNIVRFLHIAQPKPAKVVVFMELLDGRSLERFIGNKPLDEPKIRDFSEQICSALLYLHSQQPPVIHRDINCSNIIVRADKTRIKLIDFGLSIKLEQSVSHISGSTPFPKGTLNFMAPELLGAGQSESDSVQYSRESDIWAFGCSVFQMASGARPFANARSFLEMAQLIDRRGAPALPDGRSAELQDFYSRCTTKDRRKRKSAGELLEHEFLTGGKLKTRLLGSLFGVRK
uniref:Protein kinase domain-containing protein n=2 Tax=Macrostomum lignano TaxID=282301 RepID=A0A1I8GU44_9PLAT